MSKYSSGAINSGPVGFINDLQKHLADRRRGHGYLSSSTAKEISHQHRSNGALAPRDLALYSQYSTSLNYSSKAYFANSVYEARKAVELIESAPVRAEVSIEDFKKTLGYA